MFERHDLDQIINQLRAARPQQTGQVVLFGISLGAIVALATADLRSDIAALVLECPLAHFNHGVREQGNLLGMPLPSLLPFSLRLAKFISGADFDEVQPVELIHRTKCPVMAIQSDDDPFVPPEDAKQIEVALRARTDGSVIWQVPNVPHLLAVANSPDEYRQHLQGFLRFLQVAGSRVDSVP